MTVDNGDNGYRMSNTDPLPPIKGVMDFYARWPALRPRIEAIVRGGTITDDDLMILDWLAKIADMVGPADLDGQR